MIDEQLKIRCDILGAQDGEVDAARRLIELLRMKIIRCEPLGDLNNYHLAEYFGDVFAKVLRDKPSDAGKALGLVRRKKGKPASDEVEIRNLRIAVAVMRQMDKGTSLEIASENVAIKFGMKGENSDKKVQAIYAKHKKNKHARAQISLEDTPKSSK